MTSNMYALASLVSLAFLWVYIFWLYRDFRVDQFRQQLFALRDEMFDDASEQKLSFDDEAYGILRVTANGFIRFAHVISLSHVLAAAIFLRKQLETRPRLIKPLGESIEQLPNERKELYRRYQNNMHRLLLRHLVLNSPVLLLTIIVPASFYFLATTILDRAMSYFRDRLEGMDAIAFVAADPN